MAVAGKKERPEMNEVKAGRVKRFSQKYYGGTSTLNKKLLATTISVVIRLSYVMAGKTK